MRERPHLAPDLPGERLLRGDPLPAVAAVAGHRSLGGRLGLLAVGQREMRWPYPICFCYDMRRFFFFLFSPLADRFFFQVNFSKIKNSGKCREKKERERERLKILFHLFLFIR